MTENKQKANYSPYAARRTSKAVRPAGGGIIGTCTGDHKKTAIVQRLVWSGEEGNNRNIPPLFPVTEPAGDGGKNGKNTYRFFPYSPAGPRGASV